MKKYVLPTLLLYLSILISCENNNKYINDDDLLKSGKGLKITIGSVCGWCAGGDSLFITESGTSFTRFIPCGGNGYAKDTITNPNEWNELLEKLDLAEFKKITINTCYLCVDGCDTWILVKNDTFSHRISFGYNDTVALENIRPFVDKLKKIRDRF
jgi:hypothetical protein